MKIKLLVSIAGNGFAHNAGTELDRPDAEAIRMIAADQAVPVVAEKETATKKHNKSEKR